MGCISSKPTHPTPIPILSHRNHTQAPKSEEPFHTLQEYEALLQTISSFPQLLPKPHDDVLTQLTADSADDDAERGIKRKTTGKGLAGSLNTQFQKVGSLRHWLDFYVDSPPAYMTPKFGTFYDDDKNKNPQTQTQAAAVDVIEVDPELVAAFEEYMQELQIEEDNILKHLQQQNTHA